MGLPSLHATPFTPQLIGSPMAVDSRIVSGWMDGGYRHVGLMDGRSKSENKRREEREVRGRLPNPYSREMGKRKFGSRII